MRNTMEYIAKAANIVPGITNANFTLYVPLDYVDLICRNPTVLSTKGLEGLIIFYSVSKSATNDISKSDWTQIIELKSDLTKTK